MTTGGKAVIEAFSVLAMAIYFARDPASYREGLIALVPPKARHIARRTLTDLNDTIRAWISGQLLAMVFLAVMTALGLWILGVPYALAFGVFTGAVAVVPFFGTIISTLLPATFMLASGGPGRAVAVVILGVVIHLVEANVIYPMIFHVRIKLPPALTIVSVLAAAVVLGWLGLLIAVPLLASAMVIIRHVLIGQIYGDTPAGARVSAVLVPTQEYRQSLALRESKRVAGA
jgi:predicted PurR-regulated permease PerM